MRTRIGNRLAVGRARLGWTQTEAGEAAGITRQSYAAIESGTSVPSTEVALRLARAYSTPVEELFQLPDAPPEVVTAEWAGDGDPAGRTVRLARVSGRQIALPAGVGDRAGWGVDGVVVGVDRSDGTPGARREPARSVRVELLDERPPEPDLVVMGCDPAFGIVGEALRRTRSMEIAWSTRGSRSALAQVGAGRAHVAGAHLHDAQTGETNAPWIRELIPFPCTRFRFATWEEGFLVEGGNPHGIRGAADLARPDVRLINREVGSGSRLLLDYALHAAELPVDRIVGYRTAARGHLAVGEAISAGLADVGIGIRAAGVAFGLDLVPLRTEPYELIVPDHFLDLPAVRALVDILRTPGIRAQVEALQGYDGAGMGQPVG